MDQLIDNYFTHVKKRHQHAKWVSNMEVLATTLGHDMQLGDYSIALPDGQIRVSRHQTKLEQRADAAHELAHSLADEKAFTAQIRHYHSSVGDIDAHVEVVTEHAADRLLMPDNLMKDLIEEYGWTARMIWELVVEADVSVPQAMRRATHYTEGVGRAAFQAFGSYIVQVEGNCFAPFWPGSRIPEPHIQFEHGISLYMLPNKRNTFLGLLTICTDD